MKLAGRQLSVVGAAVMCGLLLAPAANAMPRGGSAADDTIDWLREQGYHVQVNGYTGQGGLSDCVATSVHGLNGSNVDEHNKRKDTAQFDTVYVDLSCNNTS